MALRGCFGCLKFLVFVVNFLFWLFGKYMSANSSVHSFSRLEIFRHNKTFHKFTFKYFLGLGVMAVSLWLLFDQQLYLQSIGAEATDYFVGTYIILGVGMLMTLVGK